MTQSYDPYGPRRRRQPMRRPAVRSANQRTPTLEDYQTLVAAHKELQTRVEKQVAETQALRQELQIKNEALAQQGETLKQTEAELVWTKAALQQSAPQEKGDEEASWQERYQRLQAEMENLRRRWEQRADAEATEARHRILLDMLPLADHLDLALKHADSLSEGDQEFVRNIEATRHAFLEALRRYDVERIQAEGAPFDPREHEAVGYLENAETPGDHVALVVQAGYKEGEKLLRPARVMVAKQAAAKGTAEEEGGEKD